MKKTFKFVVLGISVFSVVGLVHQLRAETEPTVYNTIMVDNGGSVNGKLFFKGTPPDSEKITITKDREFCGEAVREVTWVRVNNGGLAEAIVYLDKVSEGKAWPAVSGTVEHLDLPGGKAEGLVEDGKYVINQEDCRFQPWIRVYKKGGGLIVKNQDPVLHNIHFREMIGQVKKTLFNVAQIAEPGKPARDLHKMIMPRRSIFLRINCAAHKFMFSWGLAAENPYAVVVKSDGTYVIKDIPAGNYKLRAWHPSLGIQDADVTISANGSVTQNFTYEAGKKYDFK